MSQQGRILIVENKPEWRDELSAILQENGFHTDAVARLSAALDLLKQTFYHLAILDISLDDNDDPSDVEGMNLLKQLHEASLVSSAGAMQIIILSAYGTREQMHDSFTKYKVADFLSKGAFDDEKFIERVQEVFQQQVLSNFQLRVTLDGSEDMETLAGKLKLDGERVKRHPDLQARAARELVDLLQRVFHDAQEVRLAPLSREHSGSVVLLATPVYEARGEGQEVVFKANDFREIDREYHNFQKHVEPFIGGARTTSVKHLRRTPLLGGIVYSLIGRDSNRFESFGEFYQRATATQIREVLEHLFFETCARWYENHGALARRDLTSEYQQLLGFTVDNLQQAISQSKKVVLQEETMRFSRLGSDRKFINPLRALAASPYVTETYTCITHGDLHENNILIDASGYTWLIDFECTEPSHILRDVAELDSVIRIHLLQAGEAGLDERLQMEEALLQARQFREVAHLAGAFQTDNPALAKAYATTVSLRGIAQQLMSQNPQADINDYYAALLYFSLNETRFFSLRGIQRQHALLCASLVAERLG